jgi:hypothetical protein
LKTVNALLVHLRVDELGGAGRAGVIDDLKRLAHALERADRAGIDFCLILNRGSMTSGAEHDAREGTFF